MGLEAAAAAMTAEFRVEALQIRFAEKQRTEPTEIELDVSRDPGYAQPSGPSRAASAVLWLHQACGTS